MRIIFIIAGIVAIVVFGGIIAKEIENSKYAEEHPFKTMFGGAPNPDDGFYTYQPPYTGHEIVMMTGAGAGVLLILAGLFKPAKKEEENG